ncbi:MAG: hypothetical protein PHC62_02025 [Candidatus Izemoplasmatales bacterium]|jgi:putative Mn2+ efflux pump MntP|nr:hypothetical protein [Candidatus Izemoplasmatales bacterium]
MAWYWWGVIILAVIGIGYLKLAFFKKMKENSKNKKHYEDEE